MRKIDTIILHCSATPEGKDIKTSTIRTWHVRDNKWSDIGYHFVIELDGSVCVGRNLALAGAHCSGHNSTSIGVCYVGGVATDGKTPKDTRNEAQKESMYWLVRYLLERFKLTLKQVHVHNEFAAKACPSFSRDQFLRDYKAYFHITD